MTREWAGISNFLGIAIGTQIIADICLIYNFNACDLLFSQLLKPFPKSLCSLRVKSLAINVFKKYFQVNRLKYYYAVAEFTSVDAADKVCHFDFILNIFTRRDLMFEGIVP